MHHTTDNDRVPHANDRHLRKGSWKLESPIMTRKLHTEPLNGDDRAIAEPLKCVSASELGGLGRVSNYLACHNMAEQHSCQLVAINLPLPTGNIY
jgi:hypothetical protein